MSANEIPNPMEINTFFEEMLVPVEDPTVGCIDERDLLGSDGQAQPRTHEAKLPGGSNFIYDLMLIACHQAGIDVNNLPQTETGEAVDFFELTAQVFDSAEARAAKLAQGIHIDDEHGHITNPADLEARTDGCGADKVRGKVLADEWKITLTSQPQHLIPQQKTRGIPCDVYKGEHLLGARAVKNNRKGTTLATSEVAAQGMPAFCYDAHVITSLTPAMVHVLDQLGGQYKNAADYLKKNAAKDGDRYYVAVLANLDGPSEAELIELN